MSKLAEKIWKYFYSNTSLKTFGELIGKILDKVLETQETKELGSSISANITCFYNPNESEKTLEIFEIYNNLKSRLSGEDCISFEIETGDRFEFLTNIHADKCDEEEARTIWSILKSIIDNEILLVQNEEVLEAIEYLKKS